MSPVPALVEVPQARVSSSTVAKLAWPAAFVAVAVMAFGTLGKSEPAATSEVRVEHPSVTIVHELRALARLETATLRVEKVISLSDHQHRLHGLVEANDALLFVAAGQVVLGVDLSKLADGDVRSENGTAYVTLPDPEVLGTHFDEDKSYVHSRSTDMLAQRNEGLEASARREALAAFAAAGSEPQAIEAAKAQAETELRALAKAWGAKDLIVTWKAPAGREVAAGL